jgi:aminopeptidase N
MKNKITLTFFILHFSFFIGIAQTYTFTHDDTLRGSITPERVWWDLQFYHLKVKINPADSTINGSVLVRYKVLKPYQVLQIDLQRPLQIERIVQDSQNLTFRRDGNAFFVALIKPQVANSQESITVYYSGKPHPAKRAPWDGGFSWKKDQSGNDFIATSCQGLGASVWWPCKDHQSDEPDSMAISVTVPKNLMDVSNGRLRKVTDNTDGTHTFDWFVQNPINNYGVNVNIGKYETWSEVYEGEKGKLDLTYYALSENVEKAKKHFTEVPRMLKAFEHWFGPYPFYEDGYKLVEVPYLGMEHQSSVTYGNGYQNGYLGRDLSGTGWGLKWDFVIVHESGHEWFANNITSRDIADMWVHESFTNYSESLFTEYYYGKKAGDEYVVGCRKLIRNDKPIVGIYDVNHSGSADMYYKGGNMLHTIRQIVNDDEYWRQILRDMNKTFYHQTVSGKQIEDFLSGKLGFNLSRVFNQYLRDVKVPAFEYEIKKDGLYYRWANCVDGFDMPYKVWLNKRNFRLVFPTTQWKVLKTKKLKQIGVDENYYVNLSLIQTNSKFTLGLHTLP